MNFITYKGFGVELLDTFGYVVMNLDGTKPDYMVRNGESVLKQFTVASTEGIGRSFGRNSASAILGMQKLIDAHLEVESKTFYAFNPNTRRRFSRNDKAKGGGRRAEVRGKKIPKK